MALWILYAMIVSGVLSGAALLLDRALRLSERSTRWSWLFAMMASTLFLLRPWFATRDTTALLALTPALLTPAIEAWLVVLDRAVLAGWLAAAVAVLLRVLAARRALVRARFAWPEVEMDGSSVLVSPDIGPGVMTLSHPRIVVPAWVLELEPSARALLIAHEREHIRARDHWFLTVGLGLLLFFPINPFLWWQFSRLKLAIEMDCDARVLSGRQDVRSYAVLLLDVGRRCRSGRLVFAAFAAPPHAIERRIRMMLDPKPGARRWLAAASAAGAIAAVVLACQTPEPAAPDVAVREALGILPAPPPLPPPAPEQEIVLPPDASIVRNVAGEEIVDREAVIAIDESVSMAEHPKPPRRQPGQREHSALRELPPPPPPAPLPPSRRQ
jgi:beta-lactamase regulating signal transducer with metallopeptidase domain